MPPEFQDLFYLEIEAMTLAPWILLFDGSKTKESAGAGLVIVSPTGQKTCNST